MSIAGTTTKLGAAVCLALTGGAWAASAGAPSGPADAKSGSATEIVAVVGGTPVYGREIEAHVDRSIPRISFHRRIPESKRNALRREAVDRLVIEILAAREGEHRRLDVAAAVDRKIEDIRRSLLSRKGHATDLATALRRSGRTLSTFRKTLRRKLLADAVLEADVTNKVAVTDEAVKRYFEENRSLYGRPEAVRMKHFLLKVNPSASLKEQEDARRLGKKALSELKRGAKFEEVALRYAGSAPEGLEAGESFVHRGGLIRQIEDAVFSIQPGELGPVLESVYGFHVVQVLEKKPPREMTFDEVEPAVRKRVEEQERDRLTRAWEEQLKKGAKVEIRASRLLPADRKNVLAPQSGRQRK